MRLASLALRISIQTPLVLGEQSSSGSLRSPHTNPPPPRRDVAWAPATTPGVDTVASCGEDGLVLIWTRRNGETSWNPVQLHSFGSPVWRVSWSVTGNILAVSSGDSDVLLWKAALDGSWVRCIDVTDTDTGVTAGES
jgi:WD40 repeat protein